MLVLPANLLTLAVHLVDVIGGLVSARGLSLAPAEGRTALGAPGNYFRCRFNGERGLRRRREVERPDPRLRPRFSPGRQFSHHQ